jgi:hypothetical protein
MFPQSNLQGADETFVLYRDICILLPFWVVIVMEFTCISAISANHSFSYILVSCLCFSGYLDSPSATSGLQYISTLDM